MEKSRGKKLKNRPVTGQSQTINKNRVINCLMFEFDINKYLFVNKTTRYGYSISTGKKSKKSKRIYFFHSSIPLPAHGMPFLWILVSISTYHNGNHFLLRLVNNSSLLNHPRLNW